MKRILTLTLVLLSLSAVFVPRRAEACDRSNLTYDSLTVDGTNYILYVTLCIGSGRNGLVLGGDQNTRNFAFSFYDSDPGFTIIGVSPSTVTPALYPSTAPYSTSGVGGGTFCPPIPNPLNNDCEVRFGRVGASGFFTCINDIVSCGDTATQCFQFAFTVNQIPDSVRALGVEGGGIATNGCYPNADMNLDLTTLPVVWGSLVGAAELGGVNLSWATFNDFATSRYKITRGTNGVEFTEIGSVIANVNNDQKFGEYQFFDPNPVQGVNYYRLAQVTDAGVISYSEVIQVSFNAPTSTAWNFVSPVPSQDFVTLSFRSPSNQNFSLAVYDSKGNLVHSAQINALMGTTDRVLDMNTWESGFYFVRLYGADGSVLEKKIVKI